MLTFNSTSSAIYSAATVTLHDGPHGIMVAHATTPYAEVWAANESTEAALGAAVRCVMASDGYVDHEVTSAISRESAELAIGKALSLRGGWTTCYSCEGEGIIARDALHASRCPSCGGFGIVA